MTANPKLSSWYHYLLIVSLIFAVYANTLSHGFVADDNSIIVNNPIFDSLSDIPRLLLVEDTAGRGPTGYYRPVTYLSFALEHAVWGQNPVGYDIDNLLLHTMVALLFYRVVVALFHREKLALVAALVFALHPIAGETVNFHAGGRNTLLCACFSLLSLLCYIKKKDALATLWFVLAIFSKEFALLLPAFFLLYDTLIAREKVRWVRYLPHATAVVCYLVLRSYAVQAHANLFQALRISEGFRLIPTIYFNYLVNFLFPVHLKTIYFGQNVSIAPGNLILHSLVVGGVLAAAFVFKKRTELVFAIGLFFIFLLPVANIFPLGPTLIADRYAYFALFGVSLAVAYLVCLVKKPVSVGIVVVLCLAFSAIVVHRNAYWDNEISFFSQVIKDAPERSVGYQNLGFAYYNKNDFAGASQNLSIALTKEDIKPEVLVGSVEMFWEMNQLDKAVEALNKKMKLEPADPQTLIMASAVYEEMGDQATARQYHDRAVAQFPGLIEMMKDRANEACGQALYLLEKHQDAVKAERLFKEALKIDPHFVPALINLGNLNANRGNAVLALKYFSKAAGLEPANSATHYNLSMLYESMGKKAEARDEMNRYQALEARSGRSVTAPADAK